MVRAGRCLSKLRVLQAAIAARLLLALVCALVATHMASAAELTDAEQAWVAANPSVSIGVVSDNEPYSFYRNGRMMGWTLDVLERVEAETGLAFTLRMGTWPEIYRTFRAGGLDAIADISMTPERQAFIVFTDAYHQRRTVVFHNAEQPLPTPVDITTLADARVGVIKDIYYLDALREAGIEPVEYDTYRDLMAALAFQWVDGAVAAEMTGNFFARENGFSTVTVAGTLPLAASATEDFRLGTLLEAEAAADGEMLHGILKKGVAALSTDELAAITARWLSYREGRPALGTPLRLLPEERDFIAGAPPLKVGFMSDYEPFSFLESGRGQGFSVDLANEITTATGLDLTPIYDNWSNLLAAFREGEIDVIANISKSPEREAYTLYSNEYYRVPNAVYVRSGFGPYRGLESFEGRTVGIGEEIYYADPLAAHVADLKTFGSQDELMKALSSGEIDAAIMALPNGNAIIRRLGLINIEIGGEFLLDGVQREDLRFGISPRYPLARSIIDRAMNALSTDRWNALETRWLGPQAAGLAEPRTLLTSEERTYLQDKGVLSVCVETWTPPYSLLDNEGKLGGVAAEVLNRLATRGGFTWQLAPRVRAEGGPESADAPECDLRPYTTDHAFDDDKWDFTRPYLTLPMAVVNEVEDPFADSMSRLAGKRVGVSPAESPIKVLARRYPDVELVEVSSEAEALEGVRDGTLDAALGTLPSLGYMLATTGADDVKISGRIAEDWQAAIATRADEPLLAQIFDKLIADLEEEEAQAILNRQMLVRIERRVDYALIVEIALVALVILGLVVYWNRKLKRLNTALAAANGKLQELSVTDVLTGLANRRQFDRRIAEAHDVCQRNGLVLSLAMIDVDHFKRVNDEMGHVFGDQCLQHIAGLAREVFRRDGDVLARYGGEEFVVFSSGGPTPDFAERLELLRRRVEAAPFRHEGEARALTISAGCYGAVPGPGSAPDAYVRQADSLLYKAKQGGRNRILASTASDGAAFDPQGVPETL